MRRDTPGPVREAGVRHREICPTEPRPRPRHLAQDVLDTASRAPRRRVSPSPQPKGDPETGSSIGTSIDNFLEATLCRSFCWAQLPEGEKQC